MLMLYTLDRYGLTEHGGSVDGSWLTDKGKDVLSALRRERELPEGFEALFDEHCVHGYDVDDDSHDCTATV